MRICLYGGSFNPITIAHQSICRALSSSDKYDKVWLMPKLTSSDKKLEHFDHRVKMCELAVNNIPNIHVSNYEKYHPALNTTYDILISMMKKWSNYKFTIVTGSDNIRYFDKWSNVDKIFEMADVVVVHRPGYEINTKYHVEVLDVTPCTISSTQFRNGDSSVVTPDVLKYIHQNELYRCSSFVKQ